MKVECEETKQLGSFGGPNNIEQSRQATRKREKRLDKQERKKKQGGWEDIITKKAERLRGLWRQTGTRIRVNSIRLEGRSVHKNLYSSKPVA